MSSTTNDSLVQDIDREIDTVYRLLVVYLLMSVTSLLPGGFFLVALPWERLVIPLVSVLLLSLGTVGLVVVVKLVRQLEILRKLKVSFS